MSATLTEVLMAVGSFSIDFDYDPDLFAELVDGRGVLIYWGEDLIYGGIKLGDNPGQDGITITGAAPEWLLGSDDIGPTLEDKTYVAGNNKLSNPAFVYLHDEAAKALDGSDIIRTGADNWKLADQTGWVISAGQALSTNALYAGLDTSDPTFILPGDILTSDESFETLSGDQWRATVTAQRLLGTVGLLRLRLVFDGYFQHPNLLPTLGSWTVHDVDGDASISGTNIRIGPNTQPGYLGNNDFETGDFTDWAGNTGIDPGIGGPHWIVTGSLGSVTPYSGSYMAEAYFAGAGLDTELAAYLNNLFLALVKPGERYALSGFVCEGDPPAVGEAGIYLVPFPLAGGNFFQPSTVIHGTDYYGTSSQAGVWKALRIEYTVPPDIYALTGAIFAKGDATVGAHFCFDNLSLYRIGGNSSSVTSPTITIVPEESYDLEAIVTADAGVGDGTLGFSLLFQGPGRPDQVIDGVSTDISATTPTKLLSPFASPSGYDKVTISVVGTDILGGGFTCSTPTLRLSDPKRSVVDVTTGPAVGALGTTTLTTKALPGTEHVHLELIADDKGDGYSVHGASLERAETPWTSGAVVGDLLTDPLSGDALVTAGNVVGPELITFDWHVRNLTRRAQLQHLSRSGLAEPEREWRIYVDPNTQQPTIDWGTPEAIFADRTDLVFIEDDLKVIGVPSKEHSADARVTRVKVVGADRQRPNGPPIQISGVATNSAPGFVDWFGNPLNRTQTVADSSADHPDYAAGLADYKASLAATPAENVRMSISDWQQWADKGPFHVGDWVYVYKPDAGIEDPDNPRLIDGRTVWPKKLRVISRTWHLGGGFRLEIHRPGQDNYVPDDDLIRWDPDTTAELELGDPLPEFSADTEGDTAMNQFKRFRASMPR